MSKFESNIISIYGERGKKWLSDLPKITSETSLELGLEDLTPVKNLTQNYVMFATQNSNKLVLKIGLDIEGFKREELALKELNNSLVPRVIQSRAGLLLLERVIDGTTLKSSTVINKIKICCDLVSNLSDKPLLNKAQFPHIRDQLKVIDFDWDMPLELLNLARKLKDKLSSYQDQEILLHGDIYHANILRSGNSWKVIDPKGVVGYKINEVWSFVMDFEADTKFIADYFNWDVKLVRDWYFVQLIMASIWNIEDNIKPNLFLNIAKRVYRSEFMNKYI